MHRFILNDQTIETSQASGSALVDFLRYNQRLVGTKIGCREGDCGACTILVGDISTGKLLYRSMTSCLMPIGNAEGKHIVTVEGLNGKNLSPVQSALVETNGTQCGFCTTGFVMSLTGFLMHETAKEYEEAMATIDGNICRCTGYKSIERAASILSEKITGKPSSGILPWLVKNHLIPDYFNTIKDRLLELRRNSVAPKKALRNMLIMGGGTDLLVQQHLAVKRSNLDHLFGAKDLTEIMVQDGRCRIGASATVTDFATSEIIKGYFPHLHKYIKLISSTPIRNMATLSGNLVNASPIGDMTVFLLALDATLILNNNGIKREIAVKDFYKGYKQLDKEPDEFIESICFIPPARNSVFNFEKVCKRTHLDIASVNCAAQIQFGENETILNIHLAAGGVAPFPKYLVQTCSFLKNKQITAEILLEAISIMNAEISPISDARGTREYKQLLLRQLFLANFINHEKTIKKVLNIN